MHSSVLSHQAKENSHQAAPGAKSAIAVIFPTPRRANLKRCITGETALEGAPPI